MRRPSWNPRKRDPYWFYKAVNEANQKTLGEKKIERKRTETVRTFWMNCVMILFFLFYFFELPPSITGSSSCLISRIPQADAYEPIVVAPHYNMTVQVQPIYYDDFTQPPTFVGHFTTTPMKTEDLSTFLPAFDISFRPFSIFFIKSSRVQASRTKPYGIS